MKNNHLLFLLAGTILLSCNPKGTQTEQYQSIPVAEKAITDTSSVYYANYATYPENITGLPIGVFDSGTGGLTVLEAFLGLDLFNNVTGEEIADGIPDFKGENFTYLADQANMPYGNYSSEGKSDYLRELVVKDALFLTREPNRSKIVVIACNTATAYGLNDIENLLERSEAGIKVVGVINAGANASLDVIDKADSGAIGVLAAVGTISSGGYERTIKKLIEERGYKGNFVVVNQGGHGFAEAVDMVPDFIDKRASKVRANYRGPKIGTDTLSIKPELLDIYNFQFGNGAMLYEKKDGKFSELQLNSQGNYARFHLVTLIEKHREKGNGLLLKNIILGCTHYPFLVDTLKKVVDELRNYQQNGEKIYGKILSENMTFIDPSVYTAKEVYKILKSTGIQNKDNQISTLKAYISVPATTLAPENLDQDGNLSYDFKYGREIGSEKQTVEVVPFSGKNINPFNLQRIKERLPLSYMLINNILQ
ncbi:MAG: hypothetical protein WC833_13950 [Bacteroidales bacterium]|jgi:glutamate racemase